MAQETLIASRDEQSSPPPVKQRLANLEEQVRLLYEHFQQLSHNLAKLRKEVGS